MKRLCFVLLLVFLAAFTGCIFSKDDGWPRLQTERENGRNIIILPDGRRFQKKEDRFHWKVPYSVENGQFMNRIGSAFGGQVYETEEEYCLFVFVPDSGMGGWYFDESFVFPRPIVTNFGEVVLSVKGEETVLTDKPCIQAFLYRMLASKYDVKEESVETEEYVGTITFYSEEYPKLKFSLLIYAEKDKEKYYIMDWPNEDWIECTDIIEQYFSEYFE